MPKLELNEWRKEGRRLLREGLSIEQIQDKIGKYNGTYRLEFSNSKGINFRNVSIRNARAALEKVPDESRKLFIDDESFETYKKSVAQDKRGIDQRTRQATEDSGIKYNKGHNQSAATGGPTSSRNLRLENGSRNSAHGAVNPSRAALLNSGVSTSWKEDAINYQDSSGLPLELTPKDKQEIQRASEDMVDEVTARVDQRRWKAIKENPNARPIRTNPNPQIVNPPTKRNFQGLTIDKSRPGVKLPKKAGKLVKLPLLGGAIMGGLTLAETGSPMEAAAAVIDAELPLSNGSFGDGTLDGQRRRELQTPAAGGKQGPAVPTPQETQKAIRRKEGRERGYEQLQRWGGEAVNMVGGWLKQLGIK